MRDEKRVVTLNDYEQRLMVRGLTDFRNDAIRDGKPTEDVDDLIPVSYTHLTLPTIYSV